MKKEISFDKKSAWLTRVPSSLEKSLPLFATEAGHFFASPQYEVKRNYHDSFLMLQTVSGMGEIETDGQSFSLKENEAVIIDCHYPHLYRAVNEWEFFWIHFDGTSMSLISDNLLKPVRIVSDGHSNEIIRNALSEILWLFKKQSSQTSLEISLKLHECINSAVTSYCVLPERTLIESASQYIEKNYTKELTIEEIADAAGLSKYHFIRKFKEYYKETPYQYLIRCRIQTAAKLLITTDLSIDEIAYQVGFLDSSNFINKYKKYTGQTPARYRKDMTLHIKDV